jgi:iron complex outermembrane receptor protein
MLGAGAFQVAAQPAEQGAEELKLLSLEELMDLEVRSVSGAFERRREAPAAVSVVTNEDIRRSGATTIPQALSGVPGIHVGRRSASSWAVSARGFSSVSSEKLLVMSDTRSIYTPLFSGVFWDVQEYLMEDVDRVEVIRGPGATLWGSNAVNGVINITTKHSQLTQGVHLESSVGTEERVSAGARYGGRLGGDGYFRVFGKFVERDASFAPDLASSDDARLGHLGFRADLDVSGRDALTIQGSGYRGDVGQLSPSAIVIGRPTPQGDLNIRVHGGNLLSRWVRTLDDGAMLQLRAYYDYTRRNDPTFLDDLHTGDVDLQHRFTPLPRNEVVWGVTYRFTQNRNAGKGVFAVDPPSSADHLIGAFVQDQLTIADRLRITVGTKLERNDFSGTEVQPSARLSWNVAVNHAVWASASRAVRVPTRLERDIAIDVTDPAEDPVFRLLGNDEFGGEDLLAFEVGYRWQIVAPLFLDVAVFHNRYEGLASLEVGPSFVDSSSGQTVVPLYNDNLTDGVSRGIETLVTFSPVQAWRLTASHAYVDLSLDPGGQDLNRGQSLEGATPRHQLSLRSYLDIGSGFQLDALFRHQTDIERLPAIPSGEGIDGYAELDVRVAWQIGSVGLSVIGQSLLHDHHIEFGEPLARGGIERGVYAKIVWRF